MSDGSTTELLFPGPRELTERPARHSETMFEYLNCAAGPVYDRIRTVMEEWYSNYPVEHRSEFRSRLPGQIYPKFSAAFFELYLHELLRRHGYRITVHPDLTPMTTKRPEFLIESGNGERCIVEAITASNQSAAEHARQSNLHALYDAIDSGLDSPNCFLSMRIMDSSHVSIPARNVIAFLEARLATVDPDALLEQFTSVGFDALPVWTYEERGWRILLSPIPKPLEARGKLNRRPLGLFPQKPECVEPHGSIADAVKKKASRYGSLDMPYVVAVNVLDAFVDHVHIMEALFGKEVIQFLTQDGNLVGEPELRRKPDGRLFYNGTPINTRVSAVLVVPNAAPWSVASTVPVLYLNPWAGLPYTGPLRYLTRYEGDGQEMALIEGTPPGPLFGLPDGWPRERR